MRMLSRIILLLVAIGLTGLSAYAADGPKCRYVSKSRDTVEWAENEAPRGARFLNWDANWERLLAIEGMYLVGCRTCRAGQGLNAVFWAAIDDPEHRDLASVLNPERIEAIWSRLKGVERLELQSTGAILPLPMFGLDGLASVMSGRLGGRPVQVMAAASGQGCLGFFGLALLPSSPDLSLDDFRPFTASISLQYYQPSTVPRPAPQMPSLGRLCDLPLGDARQKCETGPR